MCIIIIIGRTNAFAASNQKRQECRQHANRRATKLLNMSQQLTSQKCKVKVRRVHDESIAFLTGNIYCISLDRDCHGHIVFATTDSTLNLASIPYEIIHRVAFKEKCVRLVLDSTNVKGPCIELEFFRWGRLSECKEPNYTLRCPVP